MNSKETSFSLYLVRVEHESRCFGFIVSDGVVIAAAPIAKWMLDKPGRDMVDYWRKKGGTVTWNSLPSDDETQTSG